MAATWVADLHRLVVELGGQRSQWLGVHAQPAFVEGEVLALDADLAAHEAVRAVRADEVARTERGLAIGEAGLRLATGPGPASQPDAAGVLVDRRGDEAAQQPHIRQRHHPLVNCRFDVRLVHREVVVPEHLAGIASGDIDQQLAFAVHPVVVRRGPGVAQRLIAVGADRDQPGGLTIHMGQARLAIQLGPALDHGDAVAALAQQRGQHQAGWTVANDDDVVVFWACRHGGLGRRFMGMSAARIAVSAA